MNLLQTFTGSALLFIAVISIVLFIFFPLLSRSVYAFIKKKRLLQSKNKDIVAWVTAIAFSLVVTLLILFLVWQYWFLEIDFKGF
jgi:hypothetical protein